LLQLFNGSAKRGAFQHRLDGDWTTFHSVDGDLGRGDLEILAEVLAAIDPIDVLRLEMTYQGRGAHGGTPAFYLSEIYFFGTPVVGITAADTARGSVRSTVRQNIRTAISRSFGNRASSEPRSGHFFIGCAW
jgi:hypothetical protein